LIAVANYNSFELNNPQSPYPVIYADLESYNGDGWSSTTTLNRDVLNGFVNAVNGAGDMVGTYSTNDWWGTHMSGNLSGIIEWTSQRSHSSPSSSYCAYGWEAPNGQTSYEAVFYAGYSQTSTCAIAYQFVSSTSADFDQVDGTRLENNWYSCT
jgi:hypothetical protein